MNQRRTVIVADDEPTVLLVTQYALERAGFNVFCAENGRAALEFFNLHSDEVCAAVLDIAMPELNGIDLCHALRAARPDLAVILTSGYDEDDSARELATHESVRFIEKPFDLNDLVDQLSAMTSD